MASASGYEIIKLLTQYGIEATDLNKETLLKCLTQMKREQSREEQQRELKMSAIQKFFPPPEYKEYTITLNTCGGIPEKDYNDEYEFDEYYSSHADLHNEFPGEAGVEVVVRHQKFPEFAFTFRAILTYELRIMAFSAEFRDERFKLSTVLTGTPPLDLSLTDLVSRLYKYSKHEWPSFYKYVKDSFDLEKKLNKQIAKYAPPPPLLSSPPKRRTSKRLRK